MTDYYLIFLAGIMIVIYIGFWAPHKITKRKKTLAKEEYCIISKSREVLHQQNIQCLLPIMLIYSLLVISNLIYPVSTNDFLSTPWIHILLPIIIPFTLIGIRLQERKYFSKLNHQGISKTHLQRERFITNLIRIPIELLFTLICLMLVVGTILNLS